MSRKHPLKVFVYDDPGPFTFVRIKGHISEDAACSRISTKLDEASTQWHIIGYDMTRRDNITICFHDGYQGPALKGIAEIVAPYGYKVEKAKTLKPFDDLRIEAGELKKVKDVLLGDWKGAR